MKQKLIVVGVGGLVLIAFLFFAASFIFSGDESRAILERSIAYHQEELRINKLVDKYGSDEDFDLIELKATVDLLVTSDMVSMQSIFGVEEEINKDIAEAVIDPEVIPRFEEAVSINSFSDEYSETMTTVINKNLAELRALEKLSGPENKPAITRAIKNHESILKQLKDL